MNNEYRIWCGTGNDGSVTDTVTVEEGNRGDAIAKALSVLALQNGGEWICYEIQEPSGWYVRTDPDAEFALKESYDI